MAHIPETSCIYLTQSTFSIPAKSLESTSHAEKERSYRLFALYLVAVFVDITLYRVYLNSLYES